MKKIWATAAAALLMATPVFAGGDEAHHEKHKQQSSQQGSYGSGMGGSGESGQTGERQADAAAGEQQISGTVLKVAGNNIFIEHMGAAVPFEVSKKTQFEGSAQNKKDLKVGDSITASFSVENKTRNVASRISTGESGLGGSGTEGQSPPEQRELIDEPTQFPREDEPQPIY